MRQNCYILLILLSLSPIGMVWGQYANTLLTPNTDSSDQSETSIAVNPLNHNYLMAVWNDFRLSTIIPQIEVVRAGYGFSTDGGNNWVTSMISSSLYSNNISQCDPCAQFDKYGNAFFSYLCLPISNVTWTLPVISRTSNLGYSWTDTKVSNDSLAGADKPFMMIDNTGDSVDGRIYVTWAAINTISRIWFAFSSDHGQSFSSPFVIDSISNNPGSGASLAPDAEDSGIYPEKWTPS